MRPGKDHGRVFRQPVSMPGLALLAITVFALAGCEDGYDYGWVEIESRRWYPSHDIAMEVGSHRSGYVLMRYEYNPGDGWVLGFEKTVRLGSSDWGVLEFTAAGKPSADEPLTTEGTEFWNHRMTASALTRSGPGQPLEPGATVQRTFQIDAVSPSVGGFVIVAPFFDVANSRFMVDVGHEEFTNPEGSKVTVYVAVGDQPFGEQSFTFDGPNELEIRLPDPPPSTLVLRFMAVDQAGNQSGILSQSFAL